jgi:hypothetical protein
VRLTDIADSLGLAWEAVNAALARYQPRVPAR